MLKGSAFSVGVCEHWPHRWMFTDVLLDYVLQRPVRDQTIDMQRLFACEKQATSQQMKHVLTTDPSAAVGRTRRRTLIKGGTKKKRNRLSGSRKP